MTAESESFELVGILQPGGVMLIYLDRWGDNAPVDGALTVTVDGQEVAAERQGIGLFTLRHPRLAQPGTLDLIFSITAGEEMDLLTCCMWTSPTRPAPWPIITPGWRRCARRRCCWQAAWACWCWAFCSAGFPRPARCHR